MGTFQCGSLSSSRDLLGMHREVRIRSVKYRSIAAFDRPGFGITVVDYRKEQVRLKHGTSSLAEGRIWEWRDLDFRSCPTHDARVVLWTHLYRLWELALRFRNDAA